MEILNAPVQAYLDGACDPEDELLAHINRETHLKVPMPRMLSGHFQGRVLSMLSKLLRPHYILEIGTYTGYATLCLAEGLPDDGQIHTIDNNEELTDRVRAWFDRSPLGRKIVQHTGNALELLPSLDHPFGLVFIDADKKNNEIYYDLVLDKLLPGGVIVVDNVLWSGKVPAGATDKNTETIRKFNDRVTNDPRVEKVILPVRDGIFVIRKR